MDETAPPSVVPPVIEPSIANPPPEEKSVLNVEYEQPKTWYGKIFDYSSWLVLFLLAPFTIAIFLSQNSIPGDVMYPLKLGLENIVLAGASVHPSSRAMFHANISGRRFAEAETLLLTRSDTTGLQTFIDQIETAQIAVNNISDPKEKARLREELLVKITEYQTKLAEVKTKAAEQQIIGMVPQGSSQTLSIPGSTEVASVPTSISTPIPTATPTSVPSPTPINNIQRGVPTSTPIPTPTPIPTLIPTPTPPPPIGGGTIGDEIDETQEELEDIREELETMTQQSPAQSPNREEQLERLQREEERQQKREEREEKKAEERKENSSERKNSREDHD